MQEFLRPSQPVGFPGAGQLPAGQHRLRFTVAGKYVASTGYLFGVDAIDLLDE
jgi:hypothetical protein